MLNKMRTVILGKSKYAVVLLLSVLISVFSINGYFYEDDIQVNINIDGIPAKTLSVNSGTVKNVLDESKISIDAEDMLFPEADVKLMKNATINVKRLKNITLFNNGENYTVQTNACTVSELKEDIPFTIGENDTIVQSDTGKVSPVVDGGTYEVKEAYEVNIFADFGTYPVMISEGTVADAVAKAGLTIDNNDMVNPPLTSEVYEGVEIRVTRVSMVHDTQNIKIPYEVEYRINKSLTPGQEVVVTEGVEGEMIIDNIITMHDGVAVAYDSNEAVVKAAVNKVVECGVWNVKRDDQNAAGPVGTVNGYAYSKVISAKATAYCDKGKTASGIQSKEGVVAVDPRVIPLGTRLYIESTDGSWSYGVCLAGDTGGLIKGNRVDLFYDEYDTCIQFGRRNCNIYILCD